MKNILLILFLFCCSTILAGILKGRVVKVHDGDTIIILTEDNEQIKIRFDGIDAPEEGQPFSEKSRLFVADLIAGKEIEVQTFGLDAYQRPLGVIEIDGINLNDELVRNGLAWHEKRYNKSKLLDSLELVARSEKINIWSEPNPTPPWEYRQMKKEEARQRKLEKAKTLKTDGVCGYTTKAGTPCQRKTSNDERCWQHK